MVELDGRMGHEGTGRFRDLERDNAAAAAGELTLRYGWHDVADRACVAAFQLAAVLARRGWGRGAAALRPLPTGSRPHRVKGRGVVTR